MKVLKVPEATVSRLSMYSRYLSRLAKKGIITISSGEIAEGVGVSPAQVRKDLAYFGEFGTRGVGYNVKDLFGHVMKILGLTKEWRLVIIGAGNLGTALCMYKGFQERGFQVMGIFDNDPAKVGFKLNGNEIYSMDRLEEIIEREKVEVGIITVPAEHAQEVATRLAQTQIRAILNFAPTVINVPETVELRNVDLSVNLEILTFNLGNRRTEL